MEYKINDFFNKENEITHLDMYCNILNNVVSSTMKWVKINNSLYFSSMFGEYFTSSAIEKEHTINITHDVINKNELLKRLSILIRKDKIQKIRYGKKSQFIS